MGVIRYFGLPGCGKTTICASLAYKALRRGIKVYGNVEMSIPGYTYVDFDCFGKYQMDNCLVIIDEATVVCGDRDYKNFGKEKIKAFMLNRHASQMVVLFSQEPDGMDKKIRSITEKMFYVKKGIFLGKWISNIYRIPYGVVWPSENDNGENLGKIVMGYMKPSFFSRLFAQRLYRPKYYKWFDSWEMDTLPALPDKYQPVPGSIAVDKTFPCYFLTVSRFYHRDKAFRKALKRRRKAQERAERKALRDAPLRRLTETAGVYEVRKEYIEHVKRAELCS